MCIKEWLLVFYMVKIVFIIYLWEFCLNVFFFEKKFCLNVLKKFLYVGFVCLYDLGVCINVFV